MSAPTDTSAHPGNEVLPGREDPQSWRDQVALRLARGFAVMFLLGIGIIQLAMLGGRQRLGLMAVAIACSTIAGIPAMTGWPRGTLRAWFVIAPAVIATLAGYALAGFLSAPAVLLTLTVLLAGLLLGKRAMLALAAAMALGLSVIAWAMIHSHLPLPHPVDLSMGRAAPWARTIGLSFLAIWLIGSLFIEIVGRMERSLDHAKSETLRREQAERDKANAEIASLENKQLETIGRLAAGVAHDFNNNLTTIMGSAELLKEELNDNPGACELIEDVLSSSRRAAELTRQLLAFSRKAQMVLVLTDIHELIEHAVTLLRRSIHPKVTIATQLNAENPCVLADATLLDNAILNLLVNAADAMPDGGELTISTTTYHVEGPRTDQGREVAPGSYILIEVLDTGIGIDSETLPNIFDPFFTTKPLGKGTGLGLAAVSGTIKAHSGSIEVHSELGQGSAFRILLPCASREPAGKRTEVGTPIRGSGEILLVDDDALVRRTAAVALKNLGYAVTTANDGVEACEHYRDAKGRFALVLLDLRMPRMSGEATFEALRRHDPTVPIVIWSGFGAEQDVASLLRKGAAGFVQKPYRIAELSLVVHEAIQGHIEQRNRGKTA